jgi:hypothetical protein
MKPKFLFPYWTRYLGWGFVIAHIPVMLLGKMHGMYDDHSDNSQLFNGPHIMFIGTALLMAIGLFLVAFSRERIEDEQIAQLRLDSLRWAVFVNFIVLILCLIFSDDEHHILLMNLWVPLLFFIIRFQWKLFQNNRMLKKDGQL